MRMAKSNISRAKDIANSIRVWIAERDTKLDFYNWIQTAGPKAFKGVKRKELARLLGVSTSTLNVNEASAELRNAEYRWVSAYHTRNEAEAKNVKDNLSSKVGYQKRAESKINKLEDDIAVLKMENRLLRSLLQKYETDDELQLDKVPKPPEGN